MFSLKKRIAELESAQRNGRNVGGKQVRYLNMLLPIGSVHWLAGASALGNVPKVRLFEKLINLLIRRPAPSCGLLI